MSNKKKIFIGLGAILLLLVVFGIYNNPDRKANKVSTELEQIIAATNSTMQEVRQVVLDNKICFEDESLQQSGKSAECVINLRNIQNTFRTADKENLGKLEAYYQTNQLNLDDNTKKMIDDSLRLYKSNTYSDLMNAYDQYFNAYIEWHKYFRDYVGIKGVDNMTSEEIMKAKTLAQDVVTAEDNLKLKTNEFSDYLNENFSKEFVSTLIQQGSE
ncbi:MAG: hypothetical protein WC410_02910 [Candidatus Paceibacterota bacterium]|jgi:hypothetical protein